MPNYGRLFSIVSVGTATYCTVLFTVAAAWTGCILSSPFRRNGVRGRGNTATKGTAGQKSTRTRRSNETFFCVGWMKSGLNGRDLGRTSQRMPHQIRRKNTTKKGKLKKNHDKSRLQNMHHNRPTQNAMMSGLRWFKFRTRLTAEPAGAGNCVSSPHHTLLDSRTQVRGVFFGT